MEILIGLFSFALFLLPLILVLINLGKVNSLTKRLQQLEFTLLQQRNDLEELRKAKAGEPPVAARSASLKTEPKSGLGQPVRPVPIPAPPVAATPQAVHPPKTGETAAPSSSQPIFPAVTPVAQKKSRTGKEWEALIGGKVLNRIGALALIIGVGFFLKYAFDNDWISESVRVLLGAMAGGGLLYVASRSHTKGFQVFSQGLVGAGISILYLSIYAAFNFYQLVPQWVAFVLMSVVTMITLWQSLKYDSLAVALLGWAGGFLTPFMLSAGGSNTVGLFTYTALLVAGLLSVAISKKKWMIIEPLTLAAAYFIYFLWFDSSFVAEQRIVALFFLTLFWLLFVGFEAFRNVTRVAEAPVLRHVLAIANGVLYYIGMYQLIEPEYHQWMGLATVLIAVPYASLFLFLKTREGEKESLLARYALGAIALVFSATAIQFAGFTTVIVWSVEALVCVYAGSKWNMRPVLAAAAVMFSFAVFKLFLSDGSFSYIPLEDFRLLLNMRSLTFVVLGLALFVSAGHLRHQEGRLARRIASGFGYVWCIVFFVLISGETIDLFSRWRLYVDGDAHEYLSFRMDLTLAIVWMAYSILLSWLGLGRNLRPALHSGLVVLMLALGAGAMTSVSFNPIQQYSFILNYRVLTLVLLAGGTLAHIVLWRKHTAELKRSGGMVSAAAVACVALVFILLTSETTDGFGSSMLNATGDSYMMLSYKRTLTLSLVWTALACALTWFGISRKMKAVTYSGIAVIVLGLVVGLFRSLWYEPVEWFYPLFNFRFLALCFLIAGAVVQMRLWRSDESGAAWMKPLKGALGLMIVALVLVLLTSETRDFFQKEIHDVQRTMGDNWTRDFEAQLSTLRNMQSLSLSGVWLLYSVALMVVGLWKRRRNLRIVAIGLFGISILKIFIYDLSFLQTLYRIFSFMGLGVILLGVSYLYQKYKGIILEGEERAS